MHTTPLLNLSALTYVVGFLRFAALPAAADLYLGPEQLVQADGVDIQVPGWSVPSLVYWDGDVLKDLVVGEGGVSDSGKVRVYLNGGTVSAPEFSTFFYVQSNGTDLVSPPEG